MKKVIRQHKMFNMINHNILIRCEEIEYKDYLAIYNGKLYKLQAISDIEAKKQFKKKLRIARMPKGIKVVEAFSDEPII